MGILPVPYIFRHPTHIHPLIQQCYTYNRCKCKDVAVQRLFIYSGFRLSAIQSESVKLGRAGMPIPQKCI